MSAVFTTVPNVVGLALADGEAAITAAQLVTGTITEEYSATVIAGLIVSQNPPAGTVVELAGPPAGVPPSLLLHFDGSYIDSSLNANGMTANGHVGIASPGKFGTGALNLPDTTIGSTWLRTPITPGGPLDLLPDASGDFTIECWFNTSGNGVSACLFDVGDGTYNSTSGFYAGVASGYRGGDLSITATFNNNSGGMDISSGATPNVWHHFALVRASGTMSMYLDGVQGGATKVWAGYSGPTAAYFTIGFTASVNGGADPGQIDEFRVTKGVALYTANFTPANTAFPNPAVPFVPDLIVSLVESLGPAPIGSSIDIAARLDALLPIGWFEGAVPVKEALITGIATALEFIYQLFGYVRLQTRIGTATDGFLELIAQDFLGDSLPREAGEIDALYANRIKSGFFPRRNTRADVIRVVTQLTGNAPLIVEPQRPADLGGYGIACGYSVAGRLGSLALPYQMFLTVARGTSVSDASLYAAIASVQPIATIVWVKLL